MLSPGRAAPESAARNGGLVRGSVQPLCNTLAMRSTEEQWALGDRALALEPVGRSGPRGGVGDRLDALADELGVDRRLLRVMRGVSNDWPKKYRNKRLPWAVHNALRSDPDRYELIKEDTLTVRRARELAASRKAQK